MNILLLIIIIRTCSIFIPRVVSVFVCVFVCVRACNGLMFCLEFLKTFPQKTALKLPFLKGERVPDLAAFHAYFLPQRRRFRGRMIHGVRVDADDVIF